VRVPMGVGACRGMLGRGDVSVTRTSKEQSAPVPGESEPPGGRAAERLREFEQARGIGEEATPPIDEAREDEEHDESTSAEQDGDESTPADAEGHVLLPAEDVTSTDDGPDPGRGRGSGPGERNSD
jgi:hypothetical protein